MSSRRLLSLLVAAAALLPAAPAAAAEGAPPPGLGIRLVEAPSDRADDPRARVYVIDRVPPGATIVRRIEVSNGDASPMDVLLYGASATVQDGGFRVANRESPGLIPRWCSSQPASLRLEPGQRRQASVTCRIPRDAPAGEVYGALVAERPAPPGKTLGVALRTAVRVYLSVGAGAEPASDFTVGSLTAARDEAGRPVVSALCTNTGGRALDLTGTLHLTQGPGGLAAGPFQVKVPTTLGIGQTGPVTIALDRALPAGPWVATLELRSGTIERRVRATITFPEGAKATSPPVVPQELAPYEDKKVVVPVAAALIALLLLALLVLAFLWWRRRNRRSQSG